jgi:putative flavoprotein involved in K+ transport
MGHYRMPVGKHPLGDRVRDKTNHYVTGRDGGHDIDLRAFAVEGMQLHGRLVDLRGTSVAFAADLAANLDRADAAAENIKDSIDAFIAARDIEAPTEPRYRAVWRPGDEPRTLDLAAAGISAVIWCTGFRSDWHWVELPIFDGGGYPRNDRGVTALEGIYVLGLPWLHTWGSGRLSGVGDDAEYVAERIATQRLCRDRATVSATTAR